MDQWAENYDTAAEGRIYTERRERESANFLWSLPLLNFYSKLNFLGPHREPMSLPRSLSFSVNEPYDGTKVTNSTWVYHIWRHDRTSLYGRLYSRPPFIKELRCMCGTHYTISPCSLIAGSTTSHQTTSPWSLKSPSWIQHLKGTRLLFHRTTVFFV